MTAAIDGAPLLGLHKIDSKRTAGPAKKRLRDSCVALMDTVKEMRV